MTKDLEQNFPEQEATDIGNVNQSTKTSTIRVGFGVLTLYASNLTYCHRLSLEYQRMKMTRTTM